MKEKQQVKTRNVFNATSIYMTVIALLCLISGNAIAADLDSSMFTPAQNDFSLAILSQLFGDLVTLAGGDQYTYTGNLFLGSGLDPFKDVLTSFNLMCAIVAITLGGTSLAQKLTDMSEKGQTGDFSSTLFWVRMGTGATFIMPIHYGYCVLQVLVMWLIIQSVGAADHILRIWLGVENDPSQASIAGKTSNIDAMYRIKMPSPQIAELIYRTAEGYTCAYGLASQKVANDFQLAFDKYKAEGVKSVNGGAYSDTATAYAQSRKENQNVQNKVFLTPDTTKTGAEVGAVNNTKSNSEVLTEAINESQNDKNRVKNELTQRHNALRQAEQQAFIKAKQETLPKLEAATQNVFGQQTNLIGTDALATEPFYFGVKPLSESLADAKGQKVTNREISAVCGYIDFTKTVNSNAGKELLQNAKGAIQNLANAKKLSQEQATQAKQGLLIGSTQQENVLKNKSKYDPEMVATYVKVFNQYRQQIAEAARDYVHQVNNEVRFVSTESGSWLQGPLSHSETRLNQTNALDEFNAKLFSISRNMEVALTQAMVTYFTNSSNKDLINNYMTNGFDSIPTIISKSNLNTNFIDSRNLANAMAYRDGWLSLGSMTMLLTNSINQAQTLSNFSPAISYASKNSNDYSSILGDGQNGISLMNYKTNAYDEVSAFYGLYDTIALRSTHPSIVRSFNNTSGPVNSFAALAMGLDLSTLSASDRHPLIVMIEAGYSLMNASEKFLTYNSYWDARNGKVSNDNRSTDGNPANVASQSNMLLTTAMSTMVVLGFMLAFYLPVLPFLIWIGAALGWFVAVIEAVFIAPLWAAMHLSHDGSKLVGKAQTGYSLLLSLLFRAPMMVLGFIASFTILQVYGIYLNYIFGFSIMLSLGGSFNTEEVTFVSMVSILAAYVIYAMYMQIIIAKIFNITTVLADQSLKWIGGPNGNLGEYGNMAGQELSGKVQGFAQPLGNAGLQRRTEAARMAGLQDQKAAEQMFNSIPNDQMSAQEREFNRDTMVGAGYDGIFNNGDYTGGHHMHGVKVTMPPPSSPMEKANYQKLYNNALGVAHDAGMNDQEAKQFAKEVADSGYKHQGLVNAMEKWDNNNVFARNDVAANRQALLDNVKNANNAEAMNQGFTSHIRNANLTTSKEIQSASFAPPSANAAANVNSAQSVATNHSGSNHAGQVTQSHGSNVSQAQTVQAQPQPTAKQNVVNSVSSSNSGNNVKPAPVMQQNVSSVNSNITPAPTPVTPVQTSVANSVASANVATPQATVTQQTVANSAPTVSNVQPQPTIAQQSVVTNSTPTVSNTQTVATQSSVAVNQPVPQVQQAQAVQSVANNNVTSSVNVKPVEIKTPVQQSANSNATQNGMDVVT